MNLWNRPFVRQLAVALGCGGLVAVATYSDQWWLQLVPFVCVVPVLLTMRQVRGFAQYWMGLAFFGAWILPTTTWYYTFMSPGVALASSFGFAALMANLFWAFQLQRLRRGSFGLAVVVFVVAWTALTALRLRMPVTEDWWIPHLGYAVWRNPGALQVVKLGGAAALEGLVLVVNGALAVVVDRFRWRTAAVGAAIVLAACVALDGVAWTRPPTPHPLVVAVQQVPLAGVDQPATAPDVPRLAAATKEALAGQAPSDPTFVVWPENGFSAADLEAARQVARDLGVYLVVHSVETKGGATHKRVTVLDPQGNDALVNYKRHIAPGEQGTGVYTKNIATIDGLAVTAYICYDLHYPDSAARLSGSQVGFAQIDDAEFGSLEHTFHLADLAMRAVQAGTFIVSAATDGPTAAIVPWGVVRDLLPGRDAGTLVVPRVP